MDYLFLALLVSIGFNVVLFIPAYIFKTDKLTDISYALTFIILACLGLARQQVTLPAVLLFLMVLTWAFRLGSYLFMRIRRIGKDKRFDGKREKFLAFGAFWLLQGFSVWVVMLPANLFFSLPEKQMTLVSVLAFLIWLSGLITEAVADMQKFNFNNDLANKGKWITSGLWKYSRHPNYLGEIIVWLGVFIFVASSFNLVQLLVGAIGPLYIALLIIFVSGIPLLEKSADVRWGKLKEYQDYKKKTGILLPVILSN